MKNIKSSSIVSKLAVCAIALSAWAVSNVSASADDLIFDLDPFTGDPADVSVTVHQQDIDTLRFTATLVTPDVGDLRGIFFHINEALYAPGDLTFEYVSSIDGLVNDPSFLAEFDINNIDNVGGGDNKVTPMGDFDIGFEFGESGVGDDGFGGSDWVRSITFDISAISGTLDLYGFMPIHMQNFIAARVMSLPNGGSSKLTCCGTTTVPEPSSTMGLLAFALGGLLWRRRKAA